MENVLLRELNRIALYDPSELDFESVELARSIVEDLDDGGNRADFIRAKRIYERVIKAARYH